MRDSFTNPFNSIAPRSKRETRIAPTIGNEFRGLIYIFFLCKIDPRLYSEIGTKCGGFSLAPRAPTHQMTTTTTTTLGPIYVIQMLSLWVGVARGETQLGHVHVSVFDFCASADQRNEVKDFAPFFRTFSSMVADGGLGFPLFKCFALPRKSQSSG